MKKKSKNESVGFTVLILIISFLLLLVLGFIMNKILNHFFG